MLLYYFGIHLIDVANEYGIAKISALDKHRRISKKCLTRYYDFVTDNGNSSHWKGWYFSKNVSEIT